MSYQGDYEKLKVQCTVLYYEKFRGDKRRKVISRLVTFKLSASYMIPSYTFFLITANVTNTRAPLIQHLIK